MLISKNGIELIKLNEGLKLNKYICSAGKPTIGYGHLITSTENYVTITKEKAEQLLGLDLKTVENWLNKNASWCNQNEFDALSSFLFQYGTNLLARGFTNTHNAFVSGNRKEIARILEKDFNHAVAKNKDNRLIPRRQRELKLFLTK